MKKRLIIFPDNNSKTGSAYLFMVMAMMTVFLLVTTALAVTSSGRRISAQYIRFAGLYDLALANSERAKLLLNREITYHSGAIAEEVRLRLIEEARVENYLIYYSGSFFLDGHFIEMFRDEKQQMVSNFINENLSTLAPRPIPRPARPRRHYFSYSLNVNTGTFEVKTEIWPDNPGYRVVSTAHKVTNDIPGTATIVYGRIIWPAFHRRIPVLPETYKWRDSPPLWFTEEIYSNAHFPGNLTSTDSRPKDPENALYITDLPVNLQNFNDLHNPVLLIHTTTHPLTIQGPALFNGIIISAGDVYIEDMTIRGSVVSAGQVSVNESQISPDYNMLFNIQMTEDVRREVFNLLGLTRFGEGGNREVSWILGDVQIAGFELDIDPLKDFNPQLVGVQHVAN